MKVFPIILWFLVLLMILYALPEFAAYFGLESSIQNKLSSVVLVANDKQDFRETYWSGRVGSVYDFETDDSNPALVYAATDKGLFISRDGAEHWYQYEDLEKLLTGAIVYQLEKTPTENKRIFISIFKNGQGEVYETQDRFFSLKKIFDAESGAAYKLAASADKLFLGLSDGRLISYSWLQPDSGGQILLNNFGSPLIDLKIENSKIYAATADQKLWLSDDSGKNFELLEEKAPGQSAFAASLLKITLKTVVAKQPIKFILPDDRGGVYLAASDKLYRSVNGGKSWQTILETGDRQIISLYLATDNRLIVGTGEKKF